MSTVNGPSNGETESTGPLNAAPVPTCTAKSAKFFFMKTSEKKKIQQEQAEAALAQQKEETPTPNPTTDDDQPEPPKLKPCRKPKPPPKKREPKARKAKALPSLPPQLPTSSPIVLASTRTEIDPVTAAAATPLTPSSSPPPVTNDKPMLEVEAEVDLNPRRSKRRKKSPPTVSFRVVVGEEIGATISSNPPSPTGKISTAQDGNVYKVRGSGDVKSEFLPVLVEPPSSPALPAIRVHQRTDTDTDTSSLPAPSRDHRRTRASYSSEIFTIRSSSSREMSPPRSSPPQQLPRTMYDIGSGILTIRSSPLRELGASHSAPQQPARRNAFAVLGKKKESAKAPGMAGEDQNGGADVVPIEGEPKLPRTTGRKSRKGDQKNDAIAPAPPGKTMPLDEQVVAPPPEAATVGKKVLHPFFSASGRKKIAQSVPPLPLLPPETTEDDGTKIDSASAAPPPPSRWPASPGQTGWGLMSSSAGGASSRVTKTPGIADAPWPVQGTLHVRGLSPGDEVAERADASHSFGKRKLKESIVIGLKEDILYALAKRLNVSSLRDEMSSDDYEFQKYIGVSPEVRLPKRILTTGSQLQEMIRPRISIRLPHPKAIFQRVDSDSDSISEIVAGRNTHPALLRLYERLGSELTAFDLHKCEATPWEVKYSPKTIGEALQLGREKDIFKEWLIGLKTDKVHAETAKGKRKSKGNTKSAAAKKKRKKDNDMDGFVVVSEGEDNTMDEITDPEEDDWLNPATKTKKSTVRSGDKYDEFVGKNKDQHKKTNAIAISGPAGCGKTATVFAAAKELGYTVFEVNAGARRSGKDILDLVGDMSRNHLVHQAKNAAQSDNPFSKVRAAKGGFNTLEDGVQLRQKQSLILFEEVDILFEEDKSFWSMVINLMAKSKRPIVLTCNDESLLPWDDLSLHAILRFSPPPRDLLVDHLLLMCANEGHLLQRNAVDALTKAHRSDIRACIMDLQFHCRMALGDRKGGLDWLVDRWPVGCDTAGNGETLRVVSEDTYCTGMGLVPNSPVVKEEDKWRDIWNEYGLDVGSSEEGLGGCAKELDERGVDKKISLKIAYDFFEARSVADAFASLAASGVDEPRLDSTLPKRNERIVLDDLYGYSTVQTDVSTVPGSIETDLTIYMRSLSRQCLASETQSASIQLSPLTENTMIDSILSRHESEGISRMQLQDLFAPLSKAETMFASTPVTTHSSVFPSARLLATEVAPWVRSILRYDVAMEKERRRVNTLLSIGGKRRTRAARLAVEGGDRRRKERWLRRLGAHVLKRSAGEGWLPEEEEDEGKTSCSQGDGDGDREVSGV